MDISGYEIAEILCQAGTAVAATLEREEAIERILEQLAQVVPYDSATVQLLREGYLEIVGGRGWPDPESVVGLRFPVPGDNPNTVVIEERRPYILGDAPGPYTTFVGTSSHIRSWLGVPLIVQDRVIGMLTVDSRQPDYFSSDHARLVTALASQVAVAIENSRLYAQVQQRVAELEAVRRTSLQLSSSLDLPAVLDSVAESALDLVGATDCIIYLYDATSQSFSFGTALGRWAEKDTVTAPRRTGITATVVQEGQPVVIDDAEGHPLFSTPEAKKWNVKATAAFPLRRAGRVLGVLHVTFVSHPHTFREEELRVLGLLADQAAIAIENARLFDQAQQEIAERSRAEEELRQHRDRLEELVSERTADLTEANAQLQQEIAERVQAEAERERLLGAERAQVRRQEALFRLSAELAATLDEAEVCRRVVDGLHDTLGYDVVALYLTDETTGDRVPIAFVGFVDPPARIPPGQGLSERPLLDGQLHYTPDVSQDPLYFYGMWGSEVDVPVHIGGETLGVLIAESKQHDAFDQDDFEVLTAAAQQAGLAIENARLYVDLRASQEYTRNLIDSSLDPIIAVDKERRVVEFNKAAQDTFGYRPQEILGQHVDVLYAEPGEGLDIHQTSIEQGHCIREVMNRRKSGEVFPVFLSASPLRDAGGELVGVMGVSRDITQRVQAEAQLRKYQEHLEELVEERTAKLRESEQRYRTLFDGIPVGLYRTTPAGQIVDANLALVHMLGYPTREDYLATSPASIYLTPEDRVRWQALMEREGVVRDFEVRLRRYDGKVIWVSDTARAVRDEEGQVQYYEGSLEDITERVQAEAELRVYQEHLEELVEERTAELRASEERYRTLFDRVPVGLYRTTPDGEILDANLAMAQMLGYPIREEALQVGNTADVYVDPEERLRWQALMEREGVVLDFEERVRRYDGTVIWLNDTARAVRDEQGRVLYYEGSLEDITERKEFEEELRRQKDYYEALFVNNPVAVLTADLDANVVSWNPMAEKLFGYTQQEAIGKNLDDLVANDPQVREEALRYTHQALTERPVQATTRRTRKDGSLVDVEVLGLPVTVAGEMVGYIAIYHDITELKRIERELRLQKDYYEALFINSPVAVLTVDLDINVVSWNPMAEKLFGYTQEEVIGKNADDLVANDPRVREEALHYSHQALTEGRLQATTKRTRKDGSLVDVEVLALPVIVAGEMVGFIVIYYDISELQEARRAAEAANQAKSAFLANMSHELRTPLNAILGFTQLMNRDPTLTAEQGENLEIINRSGEHLLALINDVLDMSKIEAGQLTLQETSFDLYRLLDGLEEMFRLRAEEKGLTLSFERAESVPQYVRADEAKLRQVLSNLLGNAVKFTQEGGVTLRVRSEQMGRGAEELGSRGAGEQRDRENFTSAPLLPSSPALLLVFEVEDTGPGIPPEDLAAVFDPFVQATGEGRSQEGTGLGLSISRQYVRLMGGDLTACSELEGGCLFTFEVQVGLADAAEVGAARPTRRVLGLQPSQPVYRLLVAEDDETNRRLLVRLLKPLGFEVQEVVNGQEAIKVWECWEPHLIWMDMRMPVIDGYEATRRIKATTRGQTTVIVALTASAFEEDRERVLSQGCDDFVRKPFHEDEIYEVLAKRLGVRFLYEEVEEGHRDRDRTEVTGEILARDMAGLPTGWVADLQEATVRGDLSLIMTLIDQMREDNPTLADALGHLARNFEYKKILTLIEQAGG